MLFALFLGIQSTRVCARAIPAIDVRLAVICLVVRWVR